MSECYSFVVNGVPCSTEEEKPLLRYLRDELRLTSVKDGCSEGACGTCTILVDGKAVKACILSTKRAAGKEIVTVEGLSEAEREAFVYAFGAVGAVPCGFCIPGLVIAGQALLEQNPGQVAAVIVEPVAANMGVVGPAPGFLEGLRALCDKHGALLIFDEVITGFRLAPGGAQAYFGVRADLVTFGKIIGGGMPVGAYCGSRALLEQVAPCGPVYQAGTLSGNPVAMAAGLAQLTYLREHPEVYEHINARGAALAEGLRGLVKRTGAPVVVNQLGSLLAPFFTPTAVTTFTDAKGSDVAKYARYFQGMLERGGGQGHAQFEAMFVSEAHTQAELDATLAAAEAVFQAL